MSKDVYSHYMTPVYKQILSPLDTLNQVPTLMVLYSVSN